MNKLKKLKNFNLIDLAVPIIDLLCPVKYSPNGTYDNRYFLTCLIDFINVGHSWNKFKGTIQNPINGKYLNAIHNKYCRNNVYNEIEKQILNKYLKNGREKKLKFQTIDSSFIQNKQGSVKNNNYLLTNKEKIKNIKIKRNNELLPINKQTKERTFIDFNRYNGRKKYFKILVIVDTFGTPLTKAIASSKESDSSTLTRTVCNLPYLKTLNNSKINRYKQTFLADSGYDTKQNKKFLIRKGYTPLIKYNKRNTKDKKKIKKNSFNKNESNIYKKRLIVESFNSWIKNYPTINQNYQKSIRSFEGLFSLGCSIIISKRI